MVYRRSERVIARAAERRIKIITGVIQMANDVGLDSVNINDIREYAGIATGTVYLHFPDRDEVIAAAVAHCAQEDVAAMVAASERETHNMLKLTRALQRFIAIYTSSRRLHPSLMAREAYRHALVRMLTPIIARNTTDDPEMLALAIVGALHMVLVTRERPSKARLTALLEAVLRMADVTPASYHATMELA